ncbi:MAG: hypothetical protein P4L33_08825 [Capsulimonadaceae bacterium]|nr:hypothetical protein [Capsulimonadaceae bacterium]
MASSTKTSQDGFTNTSRLLWGIATTSSTIHALMHALWLGGVIAIGALVAPAVAHILQEPPPRLDPELLKVTLTAGVIGQALRHFQFVCVVAGVLMLAADLVDVALTDGARRKLITFVRGAVDVALLVSALYLGAVLTPRMDIFLGQRNMGLFDELHRQYENIVIYFQTPLLIVSPLLTAMRDARPRGK